MINKKKKKYIIDCDGTICSQEKDYAKAKPFLNVIKKINTLYDEGNIIKFFTARGTETKIDWREITEKQLKDWGVKYHELMMGKPAGDIYIDDKMGGFGNYEINYINCPSYDSLFFALYLKEKGEKIFIITKNQDIKKYCDFVKIKCLKLNEPILSFKKLFSLTKFKLDVDLFFISKRIKHSDKFYFFGNEISIEGFYLAKLFSEKCKVINPFLNLSSNYKNSLNTLNGIKHKIGRKIFKWRLEIDLVFKNWKTGIAYGIDKEFLKKYNIKSFDLRKNFEKIKHEVIKNNQIDLNKYDILIDGGMFLNDGVIKKESLKELAEFLLSQKDFVVKNHPFFTNPLNYFKLNDKYPAFIPIELLFGNIKKNFVSIYSLALKSASKFKNLKAISLLELVKWENEDYKKTRKEILLNGTPGIIFLRSYSEFGDLLK